MEKNTDSTYLFIKNIHNETFDIGHFSQFSQVHFWEIPTIINSKTNYKPEIYIYCKNLDEIKESIQRKYIPHITFLGDDIFSSYYDKTLHLNSERFWIIQKEQLTDFYIQKYLSLKKINSIPTAIIFNPLFQENITYDEFFSWIKKLNSQFDNPLFLKDEKLQQNEFFSEKNAALIDNKLHFVVLGLFGDYYFTDPVNTKILKEGIIKDKLCMFCENAQLCQQRGLGLIKHDNNIKSCIGIKLFTND